MRKRTRTALVALAALAALALTAAATAAYTTPKLSVSYAAGNVTRLVASAAVGDDATARAAIVIPNGTAVTATAAPGTKVGTARAQVSALQLGGALLPLAGDIVVAPPGAVTPVAQAQCTLGATPQLTLLLVLQAAGQTIPLPAYVLPTSGAQTALGSAQLVFCLPPPDLPAPVGATFGSKFLRADLTLTGVFGPVVQGAWVALWTPWNPGVGTVNTAATVASPAAIAPGGITLSGRKVRGVKRLTGRVTQGGAGVATRVSILAGARRIATVSARTNGSFTYAVPRRSRATTFRARAVVAGRDAASVCGQFSSLGVPCVNPTVSGFTATSGTVRIR
jgi:hypothetical protein